MKSFTIIIYSLAIVLVLSLGNSCTRNFDKLNTDITLVTKDIIKPSLMFTRVLKNSIFGTYNNEILSEYSGYGSNQGSGVIFQNQNWSDPFFTFYRDHIINIQEVIRLTAADPNMVNEHAMGRILKVWLYHQLTDAYGDIPYTEAALDVNELINQPRYDTQEAIYTDMLKELKEAAAQLSTNTELAGFGDADLLFKGDVDKWKRFANSLRLRLAVRTRYANATLAQQHVSEVINAPLIDDNALNAKLTTINGSNTANRNPMFDDPTNPYPVWVSFTTTENLQKLDDPRLTVFAVPASDGVSGYRGRPIALGEDQKTYSETSTAMIPFFFRDPVYSIIILNAAEVSFLRAEAALAGLSSEDAGQMFRNGIQLSLSQYEVDGTEATTYLGSAAATLAGTDEEKLEQIIVQKWLGNYRQSNEAWTEFRRTGYPKIWIGSDKGSTNGEIPRRLTYPLDEYTKNAASVAEAAGRLNGGDKYMSRVWWDKKAGTPFAHPMQGMFPPL